MSMTMNNLVVGDVISVEKGEFLWWMVGGDVWWRWYEGEWWWIDNPKWSDL